MARKKRSYFSKSQELLKKSQEAAYAAIQIFNNPIITFKAETFIVLINIAWTYLLHAYYKKNGIDYAYYQITGQRKKYDKTKHGAKKHWELERCLDEKQCPLDKAVKDNLKFLIGIRHEIEHQMTSNIDNFISAKFQACCINYNNALNRLFNKEIGIDSKFPYALQFFTFTEKQITSLKDKNELPANVLDFVTSFQQNLETLESSAYSYKVIYIRDKVNHESQADNAIRFIGEESAAGKEIHNILIKTVNKKTLREKDLVDKVKIKFPTFTAQKHKEFWMAKWKSAQERNKNASQYGELIIENRWVWYEESWLPLVLEYCSRQK